MGSTVAPIPRTYRLTLLGGFSLEVDGLALVISGAAQRIMAYIALRNRSPRHPGRIAVARQVRHPGEGQPAVGIVRLRQRDLDVVTTRLDAIRLRSCVEVDVHTLTNWAWRVIDDRAQPADLEEPPALDDILPNWCDDWVVVERERLRQLRLHALEGACRGLLADGRVARPIDAAMTSGE